MTLENTPQEGALRIIIEGPDCVGKDTFIDRLKDYIQGVDRFGGANMITTTEEAFTPYDNGIRLTGTAMNTYKADILELNKDFLDAVWDEDEYEYEEKRAKVIREILDRHGKTTYDLKISPKYADVVSIISIHSKDGSPESAEFIRKLDKGEITDQREIAEEYLQVHYDLERLAQTLEETYSVVVMNRSLISFYAMQLHSMGYEDLREKWEKLWNFSDQDQALFIRLTAPEAVVRERLAKRQGDDFRGEVENFYMSKWHSIEQGFIKAQTERLCKYNLTVDTSQPNEEIDKVLEAIAIGIVKRELNDSVLRELLGL